MKSHALATSPDQLNRPEIPAAIDLTHSCHHREYLGLIEHLF
jgi:hypothetical protein